MLILDTNVLSALRRPERSPNVAAWLARQDETQLHLSVVTLGEIERGIARQEELNPPFARDLRDWIARTTTLLDMAVRERRWAQGNLQHARLIFSRGFTWTNRAHFIIGIFGFLMSPIWLAMILVGLALTANVLLSRPDYFPQTYQLFPEWPVFDPVRMLWLFVAAMSFLLVPKFIGILRAWSRPLARNAGGPVRLLASAFFEILLSALIAPVQMLIQSRQIFDILRGRDSGWEAQVRAGQMPPWRVVLRRHSRHVLLGLGTLIVLGIFSPSQLVWLSPILAGLILSPLTSRWSASPVFGRWARRHGLLVTPEERVPSPKSAHPVTRDILHQLLAAAGPGLRGQRDSALLGLGWASGGRRRSEIVALNVEDLDLADYASRGLIRLRLPGTKTTTKGTTPRLVLQGTPARLMVSWTLAAELDTGPLFRRITRHDTLGRNRLSAAGVAEILRRLLRDAGLPEGFASPHGLRSGFLTQAARDGIALQAAMRLSLHRSALQAQKYYADVEIAENPAAGLFDAG